MLVCYTAGVGRDANDPVK